MPVVPASRSNGMPMQHASMTAQPASNLSRHILPTAATMVGVCMTVISIVKLTQASKGESWIDEILALDSIIFLASAFFSYLSIRQSQSFRHYESWADTTFMWGLLLMVVSTLALSFELF